jgi:drug/metabolite transporter (DMT)-like permease
MDGLAYRLNWFNVCGLVLRTLLIHASMMAFYLVLVYVDKAKVNLAVIASMFSIAAFFTALVFYLVFNERLELKHYVGMTLLTIAIAIIT